MGDIPRSNFQFDFDFERKVLAELEKESPDWSRLGLENLPSRSSEALPTSVCCSFPESAPLFSFIDCQFGCIQLNAQSGACLG